MFPGKILAIFEVRPEIPVQEFDPKFAGGTLCHFPHQFVVLIGADEKAGGEAVKAAFLGMLGCFKKPYFIAFATAMGDVIGYGTNEGTKGIIVLFDHRKCDFLCIGSQTIPSCPIFRKGMDVGVIPKTGHINAIGA